MSDTAEVPASPAEGPDAAKKKGGSSLMLIIIIVVVLLAGIAGFLFFTPMGNKLIGKHPPDHVEETAPKDLVFFPLPEFTINLIGSPKVKKQQFLKVTLKLELSAADDVKVMELIKPRVIDKFQVYLRGLRIEDVQPTEGMQRLREELLKRINIVSAPVKVKDVLFESFLVQ